MASRDFDFTPTQKDAIKRYYGNTCAACGDSNERNLQADHWIAGDSQDTGICLCAYCNVNIKGSKYIPEMFRLIPREAVKIDAAYLGKIHENQDAFKLWVAQFRFFRKNGKYNLRKIKFFEAPY